MLKDLTVITQKEDKNNDRDMNINYFSDPLTQLKKNGMVDGQSNQNSKMIKDKYKYNTNKNKNDDPNCTDNKDKDKTSQLMIKS